VAVAPVDFRRGIDGLAAVCRQALGADPMTGIRAGHIQLPAPRIQAINNAIRHRRISQLEFCDTTLLEGSLASLGALEIRLVRRADGEDVFNHLLQQYHYLGFSRPVGEHLKYLVLCGERPIACLAWNSGPLKLRLRDELVGAPGQTYRHNLHLIAYNSRYLIAPWVKVPHLASHLLGRIARRISADWQDLYHPASNSASQHSHFGSVADLVASRGSGGT
jgi:hypothetical protein